MQRLGDEMMCDWEVVHDEQSVYVEHAGMHWSSESGAAASLMLSRRPVSRDGSCFKGPMADSEGGTRST